LVFLGFFHITTRELSVGKLSPEEQLCNNSWFFTAAIEVNKALAEFVLCLPIFNIKIYKIQSIYSFIANILIVISSSAHNLG